MPSTGVPSGEGRQTGGQLVRLFIGFVVLGIPMIGYLWVVVSDILAGHLRGGRISIAILIVVVFLGLLRALAKIVQRIDAPDSTPHPPVPDTPARLP